MPLSILLRVRPVNTTDKNSIVLYYILRVLPYSFKCHYALSYIDVIRNIS